MAYANGRLPSSALADVPTSWSNRGRREQLHPDALAALSRALLRAVAHTGTNFQLYDAYRSMSEQVAMLKRNYRRVNRGRYRSDDRSYDGSTWARRSGRPTTASPGYSNHGTGYAVDIHPGPIQTWLQQNGRPYGWSWAEGRRVGEAWHFVYVPKLDRYRGRAAPDVVAIQKAVGVTADGKFGTGTSAAVKAWQAARGLEADGIPGEKTVAAMTGAAAVEDVADVADDLPEPDASGFAYDYPREAWDPDGVREQVHVFDHTVRGVYLHHPAAGGVLADESLEDAFGRLRGYANDHINGRGWSDFAYNVIILQSGAVIEGRGLGMEPGANGGNDSNNEAVAVLLMVGDGEAPSAAMESALQGVLAQIAAGFPTVEYVRGHGQSPDADTACPGPIVQARIDAGRYTFDGQVPPTADPNPVAPSIAARIPTGKDALVALIDAPDFPLLRTPSHLCYYGNEEEQESVSGKLPNSLVPGEIFGSGKSSGAQGLKTWQQKVGIEADGRFGDGTEAATRELQKRAGLKVDGKLGPSTWYAAWLVPGE